MSERIVAESDQARLGASGEPDDLQSDRLHRYLVGEVMTRPAISVGRTASLLAAAQAMRDQRISGFPVVDEDARVVGVLSEKDIVRTLDQAAGVGKARGVLDLLLSTAGRGREDLIEVYLGCLQRTRVVDAMTPRVVVVDADAVLVEAAHLFQRHAVNRLPVVDGEGRLVGVLARQDLIRAVARPLGAGSEPSLARSPPPPRARTSRARGTAQVSGGANRGSTRAQRSRGP
ncbi:MAG: CBS domain-containing protein [Thermoplasmata archaeon]|nr:CBS domain-containing protein [Thermoplasmata archaeon]